ncbi:neutral zinc metallopeptidase [Sphingomonas sp.]|uniref:KPN_02809 family neutral zinc metallopeptidase n=1 Tax=Sphingomonas sp. TaxID=28214 RepID=UPI0025E0E653|nr:neutral zinc metallopeptidase [Sphingomonas sp.]MBV9528320.1 neutral zinc metallopeptidase [Sphingomonas sp.]
MRLGDERESSNWVDDGRGSGGGFGGGGFGGGGLGCLLPLVASRFGIGGVVVLLVGYFLLSSLGGLGGGGNPSVGPQSQVTSSQSQGSVDPNTRHFTLQVLASTEDTWAKLLQPKGIRYTPTKLHFYSEGDQQSACGAAQTAMGPFYCPNDNSIYLDTEFFQELSQRFQAPGDFPEAYVVAHEVGHHVQDLTGTLGQAHDLQARESETAGNATQVKVELQADCYAGVWAANARDPQGQPIMEAGDLEEGLKAAQAIGDDTLQRQAQGTVVPDSFTHGSSAQRMEALRRGYESANMDACTF